MNKELNRQITMELSAAHKYLAMTCAFEQMGLKVLSQRFRQQAAEENEHAMKIVDYLHEVGAAVELDEIPKPSGDFDTAKAVVKAALDSELAVTKSINELMGLAEDEKDYATRSFLQWFVDEQVEEVSSMEDLRALVELAGENLLQVEARIRHEMSEGSK